MNETDVSKYVWSEKDFASLNWHDCKIHAVVFNDEKFELHFDIDYIVSWINPTKEKGFYSFEILPCSLVFRNVYNLSMELQSLNVQMHEIGRHNPSKPKNFDNSEDFIEYEWIIETTAGNIRFKSVGFAQLGKGQPVIAEKQWMSLHERGGVSLSL